MQQLTQNLGDGAMELLEVPFPALDPGALLVRNLFSVISAGTEGKTVTDARRSLIGKARSRPKEVRKVVDSVRKNGLNATYKMTMRKLNSPSALGYSCVGRVLAVGDDVQGFAVGDLVACGGASANHAEVVAVPKHLCVRVPANVDPRHAAFTTLGALALQGVRQAEAELGSTCVVIGLGIIGLLTADILNAAGVRVIGIDTSDAHVARCAALGIPAYVRRDADIEERVSEFTRGVGADSVIIAAGTSSLDPVELAGRLCREKGKVVIVGSVPTGFSRESYYRKELDLRMSRSYGPGRYDARYEEGGVDYPVAYVRWTENRNMQAFVDLLASERMHLDEMITHSFPFERARDAYDLILERSEPVAGILLQYDVGQDLKRTVHLERASAPAAAVTVGMIGAGSFAQNMLLPTLKQHASLVGVATARPQNARNVADRFGFQLCTGDSEEILSHPGINTIVVATRHNLHAPNVIRALEAGKHVFVEKPLCLHREELADIERAYAGSNALVMVGFNRRFAPHVREALEFLPAGLPRAIHMRVNAGAVPADHWTQSADVGGGRIIGEFCHFIDLCLHIAGSPIATVAANAMAGVGELPDTVNVLLAFENGSTASIAYFSNGHRALDKEMLEVFCAGRVAVLDDFRTLTLYGDKVRRSKLRNQDKGHAAEIKAFLDAVRTGGPSPIGFGELIHVTNATFAVLDSLRSGAVVRVEGGSPE